MQFDRHSMIRAANFALLILFPLSWTAPLLRAGWLPFFELDEITVLSGLQALWEKDVFLAFLVTFLALVAPLAKGIGLALVQFRLASPRLLPVLAALGRLAMADVFLITLYVVLAKGAAVGRIETAWGLYLFTFCILAQMALSHLRQRDVAASD